MICAFKWSVFFVSTAGCRIMSRLVSTQTTFTTPCITMPRPTPWLSKSWLSRSPWLGRVKEPFWDDSAESLVTFLIIIYRLLYGYVTLFDIYEAAGDIQIIHTLMERSEQELATTNILLDKQVFLDVDEDVADALKAHHWTNAQPHHLRAPHDEDLAELLAAHNVPYKVEASSQAPDQAQRNAHFRTATRAYRELKALEEKSPNLPGNIAKGLTVFLMIMDVLGHGTHYGEPKRIDQREPLLQPDAGISL